MSSPVRLMLGIPTGAPSPRPDSCGGALLRISRDEHQSFAARGVKFMAWDVDVGATFGDGRVKCPNFIEKQEITEVISDEEKPIRRQITCGLCRTCSAMERRIRELRRKPPEVPKR